MRHELGTFDYVIVGGGTAGCVLANRLSADAGVTVAVLEAGGWPDYLWIRLPVGYLVTQNNPVTDWCFRTVPEPGLGGRALPYPRGRVLGGCSAINGMIYMRGQARDYDGWRQMGNPGWSWREVLPYFRRSEDFFAGADEVHGAGGEWRVEPVRVRWEILDAFRRAAAEVGIPPVDDFNRGNNEGCGYFHVHQRAGVRLDAARAFLWPARRRRNLAVFTHALVERVVVREGRAVAVDLLRHGSLPERIHARREVILAAGAVGSPHILQLSGIGPGPLLQRLGIPVVHALPGVGENLQDHLQIRPVWRVSNCLTLNQLVHGLGGRLRMVAEYLLHRSGPLTSAPSTLGAFARSDPSYETPNLEYHVQPLSLDRFGEPLHRFPAITPSVCNLRPTSRGRVCARTPDPRDPPEIRPNYLSTPEDRRVAADALRLTRRIMAASALAPYGPEEYRPGPEVDGDEALARAAGEIGTTIFHPVGTCRMGPAEDPTSVVDARLRLHGLAGLRVVDASIMPAITSGNTCAPVIMIAEKAADMIREDARNG